MFRRKGFTILELMIVIAVIGILVGIALPRFKGMQDEGNIARAKGELRTLQTAVESYVIHHNNTTPVALANLTAAIPSIVGTILPLDPFGGASYGYARNATYFVVWSIGPSLNGAAAISATGVVTQTNATSCIYVTNGSPVDLVP